VIILTGASGGVGRVLLPALSELDDVIGISHSQEVDVGEMNGVQCYQVDLTSESQVKNFVEEIKGRLSNVVLVHAAAVSVDNLAVNFDTKDWTRTIDVNINGNFFLTKALLTTMIEDQWGRIIHLSSIASVRGVPGTIAYSTAKTGLLGMSRVFASEYARFGITSNVLMLGYLNTGLIEKLTEKSRRKILDSIPSKKLGDSSNIVNAIDFLIKSDYVNGSKINIDGGIS